MHLANLANRAVPYPFARAADAVAGMAVIAHLRRDARCLGDLGNLARFPDVVRQRFFAIDMLALAHRHDRHVSMIMVWGRAQDRVDALLLLQHNAEVLRIRRIDNWRLF